MAPEPAPRAVAFLEGSRKARLVALDLDGTLMERGNVVSEGNAAAVRDAVAAGVHIVLATSRWYALAKHSADMLGIRSPIICHNGAMVRSPVDDARWLELQVPPDAARAIADVADRERYESMVTVDDVTYLMTRRPNVDPARLPAGMVLADALTPQVGRGAEGFLFFGDDAVDGIPGALGGRFDGVLNMASGYSETFPRYLNIVAAGADKGRALALVCERLGIALEDAIAVGDAAPDLEMMRVAGLSVAMGNAPAEVQAQVDIVGPGNREDGVAWTLRQFAIP
ncbi:MAG TPA: HAD hydrolase family protein [Dehalococcoidia bacterium]|nr:HAD hydrolase family protein [Dehalococcoidia bacterium]